MQEMQETLQKQELALWEGLYRTVDRTSVARVVVNELLDEEAVGQHRGLFLAARVTLERYNARRRLAQRIADAFLSVPRAALRALGFKQPEPPRVQRPEPAEALEQLLFALATNKELAAQMAQVLLGATEEKADDAAGAAGAGYTPSALQQ